MKTPGDHSERDRFILAKKKRDLNPFVWPENNGAIEHSASDRNFGEISLNLGLTSSTSTPTLFIGLAMAAAKFPQ